MRRGLSKMAVVLRGLMVGAALGMLAWGCASGAISSSTSTAASAASGATSASVTGPAATSTTGPAATSTTGAAATASTSTTARVSNPVASRWPTGLEALVVQRTNGFAVVDEKGVRFAVAASGPKPGPAGAATQCKDGGPTWLSVPTIGTWRTVSGTEISWSAPWRTERCLPRWPPGPRTTSGRFPMTAVTSS